MMNYRGLTRGENSESIIVSNKRGRFFEVTMNNLQEEGLSYLILITQWLETISYISLIILNTHNLLLSMYYSNRVSKTQKITHIDDIYLYIFDRITKKHQKEKCPFCGAANGRRSCARKITFFLFHMNRFLILTPGELNSFSSIIIYYNNI